MALQTSYGFDEITSSWSIRVNGEIDIATAQEFRGLMAEIYEKTPADILLDMTNLCYIDSTGFGVLIGAYGRMQEKGHKIRIANPKESIAKLLRITSLDKIFCLTE